MAREERPLSHVGADRPETLGPDEIRAWWLATETVSETTLSACRTVLAPWERTKADRFVDARDRRDYICAHAVRRALLADGFGVPAGAWRFHEPPLHKPIVATQVRAGPVACSLTHTRGLVAAAIGLGRDVGVDAEPSDHPSLGADIAGFICSPSEHAALRVLESDPMAWRRALGQLWVEKEAFAKAIGLGLSLPLASVAFDALGRLTLTEPIGEAGRPQDWRLWRLWQIAPDRPPGPDAFRVAIVARAGDRQVSLTGGGLTSQSLCDCLVS